MVQPEFALLTKKNKHAKTHKQKLKNETKGLKSNLNETFASIAGNTMDVNGLETASSPKRKRQKVVKFDPGLGSPNTKKMGKIPVVVVTPSPTKRQQKRSSKQT